MNKKSRHSLDGSAITIRAGLAIYKTLASPFYFARIWNAKSKKYVVRSTKETTRLEARKVAEEIYQSLHQSGALTRAPREMTFQHFADQAIKQAQFDVSSGARRPTHIKDIRYVLEQPTWGLLKEFATKDVREIQTKDFYNYINKVPNRSYWLLIIHSCPDKSRVSQSDASRITSRGHHAKTRSTKTQ